MNIEEMLKKNEERALRLDPKRVAVLETLEEAVRNSMSKREVQVAIMQLLNHAGYDGILSSIDIDPEIETMGYALKTNPKLNGREQMGTLIVTSPENLESTDHIFLKYFAERAGLCLDHAEMYERLTRETEENKLLSGFLRHELIGPLTVLKGITGMAQKAKGESLEECLQIMLRATGNLTILADILSLRGLDRKDLEESQETFQLEEIAMSIAAQYEQVMKKHRFGLSIDYEPCTVFANKAAIYTLIHTLTGNAMLYAPEGTVIKQQIIPNGTAHVYMENEVGTQRSLKIGLGKGMGTIITERFVRAYNGSSKTYKVPQVAGQKVTYGIKGENTMDEVYGIHISLPLLKKI